MNTIRKILLFAVIAAVTVPGVKAQTYTNFIRQTQFPTGVVWDASVISSGTQLSPLAIDPGGARFELWTVKSTPLTSYLLNSKFVGAYIPLAWSYVVSEDPYETIPRTRADRPFWVYIYVSGLLNGATDPIPSKSVKLLRHVQSYGAGGTGIVLDRSLATLLSSSTVNVNGWYISNVNLSSVPGADRSKIRGEERFSVFSQADYQAPELELTGQTIQVWPVATSIVTGITNGTVVKGSMPTVNVTLNDLYPDSRVYAKVYPGAADINDPGTVVPGSALIIYETIPQNRVLTLNDWNRVVVDDGVWTVDIMTATPFGTDRLSSVTFTVDRTIKLNGAVTSSD